MNNLFSIDNFPTRNNFLNDIKLLNNPMHSNINLNMNDNIYLNDKNGKNNYLNINNNNINIINNCDVNKNNKEEKNELDIFPNFPSFFNDNDKNIIKNKNRYGYKNINTNIFEINKINYINLNNIKQTYDKLLISGTNQFPELFPNFKNNYFNNMPKE